MKLYLLITRPDGATEKILIVPGLVHPPLKTGEKLEFVDEQGNRVAVPSLRQDTDLVIDLEGENDAIVQNYYKATGDGFAQRDSVRVSLGGDSTAPAGTEGIAAGSAAMPQNEFTLMLYSKTQYIDFDDPVSSLPPFPNGGGLLGGGLPPRNLAPIANPDEGSVGEDDALVIQLLANDQDPEGGSLTLVGIAGQPVSPGHTVDLPSGSNVTVQSGGSIAYSPGAAYNGLALGETAIDTFVYTVADAAGNNSSSTVTVTILGQNDAPEAENDAYTVQENNAILISPLDNDFDVDASDSLSIGGIEVHGDFVTPQVGVPLLLDSGATVILQAGGTIEYLQPATTDALDEGETFIDLFVYKIDDGNGGTDTATVTITVNGQDDVTITRPDAATTSEDAPVTVAVLGNDSDPDASDNPLSVSNLTQPRAGTATTDGTTVTFDPGTHFQYLATGETEVVTFTYDAATPDGDRVTETVTITINGGNDGPDAVNDRANTGENATVTVAVLTNDTDPDASDVLTITGITQPSGGAVSFTASEVTFHPGTSFEYLDAGETATVTFSYQITDGNGGTDTATVTITVNGQDDVTLTRPDAATASEDAPVTVAVLGNDSDPDASDNPLSVTNLTQPRAGTSTTNGTTVTFDPGTDFQYLAAGETEVVTFTYDATTPDGDRVTETVTITINGANDGPNAINDRASTGENATVTVAVLTNDTDPDASDVLTITGISQPSGGAVSFTASGVTFHPGTSFEYLDAGETATVTFSYQITDGNGGTDTATVTITVNGQDDVTITRPDAAATSEDAPVTVAVLGNDSDPDASDNPLSVSNLTQPRAGTAATDGTTVTFDPGTDFQYLAAGETEVVTFTYDATTPDGDRVTETVTITINGANDGPDAINDQANTGENATVTVAVLTNDTDPDASDVLTITGITQPSGGAVSFTASEVTFHPGTSFEYLDAGEAATVTFTYQITDGNGGTDTATVTITVNGQDDVTITRPDAAATSEDAPVTVAVLGNDSDPDASDNPLSVSNLTQPRAGTATTDGTTVTFDPGTHFQYLAAGETEVATFTYDATTPDGDRVTETVTITINGRNDSSHTQPDAATTTEDMTVIVDVLANDSDPDTAENPLSVTNLTQPRSGSVTTDGSTVTFDPGDDFQHLALGETEVVSFTYDATTPGGDTVTETVTITVNGVNDAPSSEWDLHVNNTRIAPVTFNAAANDTDPEGSLDLASIDLDPATPGRQTTFVVAGEGTWTADDLGNIVFTPAPGLSTQPSAISYTINDSEGAVSNEAKLVVDYYVGDIWFGNDESGSVSSIEFTQGRQLISQIAAQFSFGSGQVGLNAGMYGWADTNTQAVEIPLTSNSNFVSQAVSLPRAFTGGTDVGQGILYGVNLMLATGRPGVEKTLVILTDASSSQIHGDASLQADAASAKAAGIKLVIVAIDEATLDPTALAKLALAASTDTNGNPLLITAPTYANISAQTVIDTVGSIVAARLSGYDPITTDDMVTVFEDTPTHIQVLENDRDVNGRPLTVQSVTQGAHGNVVINLDGTVTYTPHLNYQGADSFTYTVSNGNGGTSTASVILTVAPAVPPIVIDRDGDGVEFDPSAQGIAMDVNGDGVADQLAWAGEDDAVLIHDANNNGDIDGRAEFAFADYSSDPNATDLQGLAEAFDTNHDGILSAADQAWQQFKLWQDDNGDGKVNEGEMISLDEAGIVSIGLISDGNSYTSADGDVLVHGESQVLYRDGSTGAAADASFLYHNDSYADEEMLSLLSQPSGGAADLGPGEAEFATAELIDDDLNQEIGEIVTGDGQVVNLAETPATAFMPEESLPELTAAPPVPPAASEEDLAAAYK